MLFQCKKAYFPLKINCFCSILPSQTFLPAILNHRCVKCSWKPKKMPNDLSIAPLDFDTWPVVGVTHFRNMRYSVSALMQWGAPKYEDWRRVLFKIEKNCFCKVKEIGRKTDQRIRGQENVLLSWQNCQNISDEKTHRCNVNLKQ